MTPSERGAMSRRKGARGERQVAALMTAEGHPAKRDGRLNGDIAHQIPGLHIETKRQERVQIMEWIKQAEADCPNGKVPAVVWRRSNMGWRIDLPFTEFLRMIGKAEA